MGVQLKQNLCMEVRIRGGYSDIRVMFVSIICGLRREHLAELQSRTGRLF